VLGRPHGEEHDAVDLDALVVATANPSALLAEGDWAVAAHGGSTVIDMSAEKHHGGGDSGARRVGRRWFGSVVCEIGRRGFP
jgi:hypothetical protein